jgi:hypothetical protein
MAGEGGGSLLGMVHSESWGPSFGSRPASSCDSPAPILLLSKSLQPVIDKLRNHLLQDGKLALAAVLEVACDALLDILAHLVDLHIDIIAGLLACSDNLLLRVRNEHDLPEPVRAIRDLCHRETRAVYCHVALLDDVAQHGGVARLEAEGFGVAVGRDGLDGRDGVDMALHEVAAHARVGAHGALKVDLGALLQRAQVCAAQRLGRAADLEPRLVELGDGQTCSCLVSFESMR